MSILHLTRTRTLRMTISIFSIITFSFIGQCTQNSMTYRFIVSSELKINIHADRVILILIEKARHLHGKRRCCMPVMYMRFSTDACDDFCFIRFKINCDRRHTEIFSCNFIVVDIDYIHEDIMKIEYSGLLGPFSLIFCHFRVTPALLSFLRTFLKRVSMFEKLLLPQYTM